MLFIFHPGKGVGVEERCHTKPKALSMQGKCSTTELHPIQILILNSYVQFLFIILLLHILCFWYLADLSGLCFHFLAVPLVFLEVSVNGDEIFNNVNIYVYIFYHAIKS